MLSEGRGLDCVLLHYPILHYTYSTLLLTTDLNLTLIPALEKGDAVE